MSSLSVSVHYSYEYLPLGVSPPNPEALSSLSEQTRAMNSFNVSQFALRRGVPQTLRLSCLSTFGDLCERIFHETTLPRESLTLSRSGKRFPSYSLETAQHTLESLGVRDGDRLDLSLYRFPGPLDLETMDREQRNLLVKTYPPPANLDDLGRRKRREWAEWISASQDSVFLSRGSELPFEAQYFNPANVCTPFSEVSVTRVLAWNGFPGRFRASSLQEGLEMADVLRTRDGKEPSGEDDACRYFQDEYCEWWAKKSAENGKVERITLTCEGPEYWRHLFEADLETCLELYRDLTGHHHIEKEDLVDADGKYNPYNRYNTRKGLVHMNQPNNSLFAEIGIAADSTRVIQPDRNGIEATKLTLPLSFQGQFGSIARNSDPMIVFVGNWIARSGLNLRMSIEPPVGIYFGELLTAGWSVPEGKVDEWVQCTRGDASKRMALRYEIAVPEKYSGKGYSLEDVKIGGEPLKYGGQVARCMVVQLTGRAAAGVGTGGNAPPQRTSEQMREAYENRKDPISGDPLDVSSSKAPSSSFAPSDSSSEKRPCRFSASDSASLKSKLKSEPSSTDYEKLLKEAEKEVIVDVDDVQGDVIWGFNAQHSLAIFLDVPRPHRQLSSAKQWLKDTVLPSITTARSVRKAHDQMNAYRSLKDSDSTAKAPENVFLNVSFSNRGVALFASEKALEEFHSVGDSEAFYQGQAARSTLLGDPSEDDSSAIGSRSKWVVGKEETPHLLLHLQADRREDMLALAEKLLEAGADSIKEVHRDEGKRRDGAFKGFEHFGFRDGISNPFLRGYFKKDGEKSLISKRYISETDPRANFFARPGNDLLWPGEFLLGLPKQAQITNRTSSTESLWLPQALDPQSGTQGSSDSKDWDCSFVGPSWARNGSFLNYRRLRQDVSLFWNQAKKDASSIRSQLKKEDVPETEKWDMDRVAANRVGRHPSGCPLMSSLDKDLVRVGRNPLSENAFSYAVETSPFENSPVKETLPEDNLGIRCPVGAHIRKMNPRDQAHDFGSDKDTLKRRIIRRGSPYGEKFLISEEERLKGDDEDRGLLFISYQASIDLQFEFISRFWANVRDQPTAMTSGSADDMVLGQPAELKREFTVMDADQQGVPRVATVQTRKRERWVWATGGGYFFLPSVSALKTVFAS